MNKFDNDFDYYTTLIKTGVNFSYARYADGEVRLMKGEGIGTNSQAHMMDKWLAPNQMTKVGMDLLETLTHTEENYHYAISGKNDNILDYEFLTHHISNKNLTFANLWINANYQKMKEFYQTLEKEVYLICNHSAEKKNFPFKVVELFPFPDDCIGYWNTYGDGYLSQLLEYTSQIQNKTVFVSAGPISEILIHEMYNSNSNNQYIDVGSSIDEFVHGRITRPYMNPLSHYSKQKSNF
jgi:hypothetical protein